VGIAPAGHYRQLDDRVHQGQRGGQQSGKFSGRTTVHVTPKFPMTKPDSCTVAVIASLNPSGRIHLWVTGKRVPPGS
jgi:hypothetical protein